MTQRNRKVTSEELLAIFSGEKKPTLIAPVVPMPPKVEAEPVKRASVEDSIDLEDVDGEVAIADDTDHPEDYDGSDDDDTSGESLDEEDESSNDSMLPTDRDLGDDPNDDDDENEPVNDAAPPSQTSIEPRIVVTEAASIPDELEQMERQATIVEMIPMLAQMLGVDEAEAHVNLATMEDDELANMFSYINSFQETKLGMIELGYNRVDASPETKDTIDTLGRDFIALALRLVADKTDTADIFRSFKLLGTKVAEVCVEANIEAATLRSNGRILGGPSSDLKLSSLIHMLNQLKAHNATLRVLAASDQAMRKTAEENETSVKEKNEALKNSTESMTQTITRLSSEKQALQTKASERINHAPCVIGFVIDYSPKGAKPQDAGGKWTQSVFLTLKDTAADPKNPQSHDWELTTDFSKAKTWRNGDGAIKVLKRLLKNKGKPKLKGGKVFVREPIVLEDKEKVKAYPVKIDDLRIYDLALRLA